MGNIFNNHPKLTLAAGVTAVGLLAGLTFKNWDRSDSSTATNSISVLDQLQPPSGTIIEKIDPSYKKIIDKFYPGLSNEYKYKLLEILKECKEQSPELMPQFLSELEKGIDPNIFDRSGEPGVTAVKAILEFLPSFRELQIDTLKMSKLDHKDPVLQRLATFSPGLIDQLNSARNMQEYLKSGEIDGDALLRAMNANDPKKVALLLAAPFSAIIANNLPSLTQDQAATLAIITNSRDYPNLPRNSEDLTSFLSTVSKDPAQLEKLQVELNRIAAVEERASKIDGLDLKIISATSPEASNLWLSALESGVVSPKDIEVLSKLSGVPGLPSSDAEVLNVVAPHMTNQNFLAEQKDTNSERISRMDLPYQAYSIFENLHPKDIHEILDAIDRSGVNDSKQKLMLIQQLLSN